MTDNEIIKALECCIAPKCGECPIFNNSEIRRVPGRCVVTLEKNALDLINRQAAEIERLQKDINVVNNVIKSTFLLKADKNNDPFAEIKAEAIKKFAEKLKEETIDIDVSFGYGREHYTEAVTTIAIDNLVKEMVGDING